MAVPNIFSDNTAAIAGQFNDNFAYLANTSVAIGSIIPFYDFNGALTFNALYWAYCNGQTKAVGTIGSQVLPDLSNRYLVGFGTEAGGDNGSAAWATSAVGNASHQINIAHTHTLSHTHSFSGSGTTGTGSGANYNHAAQAPDYFVNNYQHTHGVSISGTTGSASSSTTSSGLSTTQSIQPRSIAVRFLMRIL